MMITRNEEEKCNNHSYAVLYYIPFYCNISLVFYAHCTHHMLVIYISWKNEDEVETDSDFLK